VVLARGLNALLALYIRFSLNRTGRSAPCAGPVGQVLNRKAAAVLAAHFSPWRSSPSSMRGSESGHHRGFFFQTKVTVQGWDSLKSVWSVSWPVSSLFSQFTTTNAIPDVEVAHSAPRFHSTVQGC
jgi:hypothetical protein